MFFQDSDIMFSSMTLISCFLAGLCYHVFLNPRTLISGGADVKRSNMRGMTSLHLGAESGSTSVVRLLVGAGALVSAVDINEDTALHYSARAGEDGTARVLLDSGCDVTRFNQHGENALLTAIRNNNENIIGLLVRCSKWREAVKAQIKPLHKKPPGKLLFDCSGFTY